MKTWTSTSNSMITHNIFNKHRSLTWHAHLKLHQQNAENRQEAWEVCACIWSPHVLYAAFCHSNSTLLYCFGSSGSRQGDTECHELVESYHRLISWADEAIPADLNKLPSRMQKPIRNISTCCIMACILLRSQFYYIILSTWCGFTNQCGYFICCSCTVLCSKCIPCLCEESVQVCCNTGWFVCLFMRVILMTDSRVSSLVCQRIWLTA